MKALAACSRPTAAELETQVLDGSLTPAQAVEQLLRYDPRAADG